jgi:hypothetical protein
LVYWYSNSMITNTYKYLVTNLMIDNEDNLKLFAVTYKYTTNFKHLPQKQSVEIKNGYTLIIATIALPTVIKFLDELVLNDLQILPQRQRRIKISFATLTPGLTRPFRWQRAATKFSSRPELTTSPLSFSSTRPCR